MKKIKNLLLILFTLVLCATAFTLTACGSKNDPPAHTHSYQWVDNGDGTHKQHCSVSGCTVPDINSGSHDYGTNGVCVCGKAEPVVSHTHNYQWVDNSDGTHKQHCSVSGCDNPDINSGSHIFDSGDCVCGKKNPISGHTHVWSQTYEKDDTHHWYKCTVSGCTEENGYAAHNFTSGNCICGKEKPQHAHKWSATWEKSTTHHWHNCTADGCAVTDNSQKEGYAEHIAGAEATLTTAQTCIVCGYIIAEPIGHIHSTTLVPANSATCTESGNVAYYTCTCGKYFLDKDSKTEIGLAETVINNLGHDWETTWTIDVEATLEHAGSKSHHCSRCSDKTDITEIPRLTVTTYNVIFNANGGKIDGKDTKTVTGTVNQKISRPNNPTRTDYTFKGWYKDGATTTLWDFDTDVITGATTLYAGWEMNVTEYDVTFVHNYPNSANIVKTTENGLITYIPTRSGYVFNGWWYSDGQTADGSYILTDKFDTSKRVTRAGLTLYAEWVQERTSDSQLYSPSVSISEDGVFSWSSISNAQGYKVEVYSGMSKVAEQSLTATSWTFPNSMTAGYYIVKIRANGDGETTVNSAWAEKYYSHHMLGYVDWSYNTATSILTWSAVKNATAYEVRINGVLKETITYTTYDISDLDAGDYTISVTPIRDGWTSSTAVDYSVSKKRLKTPTVTLAENNDCTYTVSWLAIAHANTYRIKHHDTYITVTDTSYTISNDSPIYGSDGIGNFTVCAFDSNADYFISGESMIFEVKKIYSLTLNKSNNSAGTVSSAKQTYKVGDSATVMATTNKGYTFIGWYDGDIKLTDELGYTFTMPNKNLTYTATWTYYTLTLNKTEGGSVSSLGSKTDVIFVDGNCDYTVYFNLNGGVGTVANQIITKNIGLTYPATPIRTGYVFAGWYSNSSCDGNAYDFSTEVNSDITLYAKWLSYSGEGTIAYNGNKSVSVVSKSSSTLQYYAFVPLVSGSISIYSANGLSDTYGYLYDGSKNQLAYDDDSGSGSNFKITYNVIAGRLYYIRPCGYSSSGTTTVYINGENPATGGKSGQRREIIATAEQSVTVTAETDIGYTWLGWFDGDTKLTDNLSYTFTMPSKSKTYTAKWCRVIVASDDDVAGSVTSLMDTYKVGNSVTVTAATNIGYIFVGWYDGDCKLTDELSYTFTMPSENKTLMAKWCKVAIEINDSSAGSVTSLTDTYKVGDSGFVTATMNKGYTFVGWYEGDHKLTDELSYTFAMPSEDKTFTAKFEVSPNLLAFTFTSSPTTLNITGVRNKAIKQLVVPDDVTSIDNNAFGGCSSLESITIPFLTGTIGKLFGSNSYTGGVETRQYYYNDNVTIYYIPSSLKNVTVTGGNIPYGAFSGCSSLTTVMIPDDATSIGGRAFSDCSSLTAVTIPDGVISVGDMAFNGCSSLATMTIPNSVTSVGSGMFFGCSSLVSVNLGNQITELPTYYRVTAHGFFGECSSLKSVIVPNGLTKIGINAFDSCNKLKYNEYSNGLYLGNSENPHVILVKSKSTAISSCTINNGTKVICDRAFAGCNLLTSIIIPNSVTSVGAGMFYNCSRLVSVKLSNQITELPFYFNNGGERGFFEGCSSLTSIIIPDSMTVIGRAAFENCDSLMSIKIPETITKIDVDAFRNCDSLVDIKIPSSVISIGESAFMYCNGLTSITIPNNVTEIGRGAFGNCPKLVVFCEAVDKPNAWSDDWSFSSNRVVWNCHNNDKDSDGYRYSLLDSILYRLKDNEATVVGATSVIIGSITIPSNIISNFQYAVTNIGEYAFWYCKGLTSITIPNSVTSIDAHAFYYCDSLMNVSIGSSVTSIGWGAFYKCSSLTIYCELSSKLSGWNDGWNYSNCPVVWNCASNEKDENGYDYSLIDGIRYRLKDGTASVAEQRKNISGAITIPRFVTYKGIDFAVTTICDYAFDGCKNLTNITIPDSIIAIGDRAFSNCTRLLDIIIPNSVTSIGGGVFYGCSSMTSIQLSDQITELATCFDNGITCGFFEDCSSLMSITIPDSVTSIGDMAFSNCMGLLSIIIPNSVTSVGGGVFYGCSSMTSIQLSDQITELKTYFQYSFNYGFFERCSSLISITIPDGVTSIGAVAFANCSALTSIVIPNSVTSVGASMFYNCISLTMVQLSSQITELPTMRYSNSYHDNCGFFEGCINLEEIIFKHTKSSWYSINKGTNWNYDTGNYIIYCTDGNIVKS